MAFREAVGAVGAALGVGALFEAARNGVVKIIDKASESEAERQKTIAESRSEVIGHIRKLASRDPKAQKNFEERHRKRLYQLPRNYGDRKPYSALAENEMVAVFVDIYKHHEDKPDVRDEVILSFCRMETDEQFDQWIEAAKHDYVQKLLKTIVEAGLSITAGTIASLTESLRNSNASQRTSLNKWLEDNGFRRYR